MQREIAERQFAAGHIEAENGDRFAFALHFDPLAGEFVELLAVFFDRRNHRRGLHLFADEAGEGGAKLLPGHAGPVVFGGHCAVEVAGIGFKPELQRRFVNLVLAAEFRAQLSEFAEHQHKQAGGGRIERAAMSDLRHVETGAHEIHHIETGPLLRLVHQQNAAGLEGGQMVFSGVVSHSMILQKSYGSGTGRSRPVTLSSSTASTAAASGSARVIPAAMS